MMAAMETDKGGRQVYIGDDSPVDKTAGERGEYGREAGGYGGRQEYGKR